MKRRQKTPTELYEEAVHLVRNAPARVIAAYYIGALPFILCLLFFWADMTQDAAAWEHCLPGSLAVALLYGWMIYCQTNFVRGLQSELCGSPAEPWFSGDARRFAFTQITLQPTKYFFLPAAALMILPYAGAYAFYQNLMATGGDEPGLGRAIRAARKHSGAWQTQNWAILAILFFLNLIVFMNIGTAIIVLPLLLKVFLGIDTVFSRSGASAVNTTFFAITAGLTYLVTNPVAKAVYLLRYFYAESRDTGDDLRAEYKSNAPRPEIAAAVLRAMLALLPVPALFLILLLQPASLAQQPAATPPPPTVTPAQLNQAIDQVIHNSEFTWRLPRPPRPAAKGNWLVEVTEQFLAAMGRGIRQLGKWIDDLVNWIGDKLKHIFSGIGGNQPAADARKLRLLVYSLLAGVAIVLSWLVWQVRRHRKRRAAAKATPIAIPIAELNNPDLLADQQPLDEWLLLARDCMARQEFRLALRAFYLAGLSYLAGRALISIQRGKSNRDYARELRRKARNEAGLLAAFHQNLGVFEKSWYGMYDVDRNLVEQFEATLSQMRSYASQQ